MFRQDRLRCKYTSCKRKPQFLVQTFFLPYFLFNSESRFHRGEESLTLISMRCFIRQMPHSAFLQCFYFFLLNSIVCANFLAIETSGTNRFIHFCNCWFSLKKI